MLQLISPGQPSVLSLTLSALSSAPGLEPIACLLQVLPLYNNTPVATLLSEYIETGLAYAQVSLA